VIDALVISQLGVERRLLPPAPAAVPGADSPALVVPFATLLETGCQDRAIQLTAD
jgi:hypothetical protein